jgi:hypothetical protein
VTTGGNGSILLMFNQSIAFTSTAPTSAVVGGGTYSVNATGGASGNAVTFSIDSSATSVCSVTGSTVSFIGVGTCVINANQAGNASYTAAPQVQQSFIVSPLSNYTAASPGGSGNITAGLAGGGTSCSLQSISYQSANSLGTPPPAGVSFPQGVVNFTTSGCTANGTITVTLTYPDVLPAGTQFWKYGPRRRVNPAAGTCTRPPSLATPLPTA